MGALPGQSGQGRSTEGQAALRRVATLVARAAAPEDVFAAVTEEAGQLLGADYATMIRYDSDTAGTVVADWTTTGRAFPVGDQLRLGGRNVPTLVSETHRAARIDDYSSASGPAGDAVREWGILATAGVPVGVEGRLWGVVIVGSRTGPLPAGTEARLAVFTELAATAVANAEARVKLRRFAEEQAALRRVATLVAQGTPPKEVVAAVTEEAGRLLRADYSAMARYEPDATIRLAATWDSAGLARPLSARWSVGGQNLHTMIFQTGRPARIDDAGSVCDGTGQVSRELGVRAVVGVPVSAQAVRRHDRGIPYRAAAGRHGGAAGRVHRTGGHRDRQRRSPGCPHRLARPDRGHR